ncbi:MAG: hypothetical protein GY820_26885 [Gammaproteobacteria bacterium]|nr:hypothetical protein [Gammaproteobacteria bacterium]
MHHFGDADILGMQTFWGCRHFGDADILWSSLGGRRFAPTTSLANKHDAMIPWQQ